MKQKFLRRKGNFTLLSPCYSGYFLVASVLLAYSETIQSLKFNLPKCCYDFSATAQKRKMVNQPNVFQFIHMIKTFTWFLEVLSTLQTLGELSKEEIETLEITSFFRSDDVNKAVGGSDASLHRYGLAFDFRANQRVMNVIFDYIHKTYFVDNLLERYNDCIEANELKTMVYPFEMIKYYKAIESYPDYIHIGLKFILPLEKKDDNYLPF